ncbi:hypothetical protein Acid7E03_35570 [Acidisoma sp. 7E03]
MKLEIDGNAFTMWTRSEVTRDLQDIAGSFIFDYDDLERFDGTGAIAQPDPAVRAEVVASVQVAQEAIRNGQPVTITLDGETVLIGWIEDIRLELREDRLVASISGRDATGDLVDCTANPTGPAEYRNIDLLSFCQAIAKPFGITVTSQVSTGDPFDTIALDASEPAMAAIEKVARQRAVLVTSDGVGGLVLTGPGTTRGPAPLVQGPGGNVHYVAMIDSWRCRASDYYVKAQFESHLAPAAPRLDATVVPFGTSAPPPPVPDADTLQSNATTAITLVGHAIDPEINRYRPMVWLGKTQSRASVAAQNTPPVIDPNNVTAAEVIALGRRHGGRRRRKPMRPRTDATPWTVQDQAEWRRRTQIALGSERTYEVVGWRAGSDMRLWRPNELVQVNDSFTLINADRLVAAVTYLDGEDGARTRLRVVLPDLYDLKGDIDTSNRSAGRRRAHHTHAIDATAGRYR